MTFNPKTPWLKVSGNRRYLCEENGAPFIWVGDTAWAMLHRLNREEAFHYLRTRAEQRFTVVQTVALAQFGGLSTPNAQGHLPLGKNEAGQYDPTLPLLAEDGDDYWSHVDYVVDLAAQLGLYIALLPTWGDKFNKAWGEGPVIFGPDNARQYGRWLGERYRHRPNIIWVLGGDRPLDTSVHFRVVQQMAEGLKEGDEGRHLMTFHPRGASSSSLHLHDEPWLDFHMIQSGHNEKLADRRNAQHVERDYALQPVKPTLDGEPCYEDHPRGFNADNGYFDAADVRHAAYTAVLSGAFGHTYGHHSVWSMTTEPNDYYIMTWQAALRRPGAEQMRHLRRLLERLPLAQLKPDQELLAANYGGANRIAAASGERNAYAYTPNGLPVVLQADRLFGGRYAAAWFDPRTGEDAPAAGSPADDGVRFVPPASGRGNDWVLVVDGH